MKRAIGIVSMQWLRLFVLISACSGYCCRSAPPFLKFDGELYHLAQVDVTKERVITNEYLKKDETLSKWTAKLVVNYWPNAKFGDVAGRWLDQTGPMLTKKVEAYRPEKSTSPDDIVLEAHLRTPDPAFCESKLMRFISDIGSPGVSGYQFVERTPTGSGKPESARFETRRKQRTTELMQFQVPPFLSLGPKGPFDAGRISAAGDFKVEDAILGASLHEEGFGASFIMKVRRFGRLGDTVFLNSEEDYRDPTCLSVVISGGVAETLARKFGSEFPEKLVGREIRVKGVARQVLIYIVGIDRTQTGSYHQYHLELEAAEKLQVL